MNFIKNDSGISFVGLEDDNVRIRFDILKRKQYYLREVTFGRFCAS